jgi:capsular polysaccharide biosynthesis protein
MSQPMNLRRCVELMRRNKALAGAIVGLGLLIGAVLGSINPPQLTSSALVIMPNTKIPTNTLVIIATSDPVLSAARPNIEPPPDSNEALRNGITVTSSSSNIVAISAAGGTAATAESAANAMANAYVGYLASPRSPIGQLNARVLEPATTASGPSPLVHRLVYALIGAIAGLLAGLIAAIARGRGDRRLRSRDDIANAIGVPVLASLPTAHPANPQDWAKLLDSYEPGAVHGWRLRKALQHLNVAGVRLTGDGDAAPPVIAVATLTGDSRALALGPQLAVVAASLGISTALAVGPSEDPNLTAALQAACAGWAGNRSLLRTAVLDESLQLPRDVALTVLVTVLDGTGSQPAAHVSATATLIGVSSGGATAEQLAAAAAKAAGAGQDVAGLLVADPERADRTTGRSPQLPRPVLRVPTRVTGMKTEVTR